VERADKGEEGYRELNRGISHDCCCCKKIEEERGELAGVLAIKALPYYCTPLHFIFLNTYTGSISLLHLSARAAHGRNSLMEGSNTTDSGL